MALTGLKPPAPLKLDENLALNWKSWYNAFDIYATAAGVANKPEKVQCCVFLHVAGLEAQKVFRTLHIDSEDQDKLTPLINAFKEYCVGKTNITVTRYQFNSYDQSSETMDTYIRELQNRITYCDYGVIEDSMLCDRLVCGVRSNTLRDRLLQTHNLNLTQCLDMCRLSEHNAAQLAQNPDGSGSVVDAIARQAGRSMQTARTAPKEGTRSDAAATPAAAWNSTRAQCSRCGYKHVRGQCPAAGKECTNCKKVGHFYKMCNGRKAKAAPVDAIEVDPNNVPEEEAESSGSDEELFVGRVEEERKPGPRSWYKTIMVGTEAVRFKLDSGSEANIIPKKIFDKIHNTTLKPSICNLVTYSGERFRPEGETTLNIRGRGLRFHVTTRGGPILGLDACLELKIIERIDMLDEDEAQEDMSISTDADNLVNTYADVFKGLGTIMVNAHIHVDKTVTPVVDPPRRIPHAIEKKVKEELEKMIKLGVIAEQVEPTPWVSSITIVKKPNKIRICLDPTKLNKAIKRGQHATKTIEEVIAKTSGARYFSVIDANKGYWQIKLDIESSKLTTFNTPWGRYRYTRLPFGIKTAGDIFIFEMGKILGGLEGVDVITDDILIYGRTIQEHNNRLETVLKRARKVNLKLNPEKSVICKTTVNYVGHTLTPEGVKPSASRIQAINEMVTPTDKKGIQRFLGMVGYVGKFIPNLSELAKPLRTLLKKEVAWHWQHEQKNAFKKLKQLITRAPVLKYYNVHEEVILQVDASKSGLGAALLQQGKPVAMASKALDDTQSNYAVIEKELLAICFGCVKFHEYIFGKNVVVQTDHKPLVSIMNKPIYQLSARMQRMRMRLQNYDLTVTHIKGINMYFADALSRAHTTSIEPHNLFDTELSVTHIGMDEGIMKKIVSETSTDITMTELIRLTKQGWPNTTNEIMPTVKPYFTYKDELTVSDNVLLKGDRIVIPRKLQHEMLKVLHESHLGMVKTKQLAKESVFWPGMSSQIEDKISRCEICQSFRNLQHVEPLVSHKIPELPFNKVGVDLFQIENMHFLVLVDYYSKYPEVVELQHTDSKTTITALKHIFARHGIPETIVSDNGPQFTSQEYHKFKNEYNFKQAYTSPQHPQSNGQIERFVQTTTKMIKKAMRTGNDYALALLNYRNTPIDKLNASPAQLLMGRRLNSKIPTIKKLLEPQTQPCKTMMLKERQSIQKKYYDKNGAKEHTKLCSGDNVRYLNHMGRWVTGKIIKMGTHAERNYEIQNEKNHIIKRNRKDIFKIPKKISTELPEHTTDKTADSADETLFEPEDEHYVTRYGRVSHPVSRYGIADE